jgi:release factor glutamine methyltransferase
VAVSELATIAHALAHAKHLGLERLDALLLLGQVTGQERTWLIAHSDSPLTAPQSAALLAHFARRVQGEPLAYLLGEKEFHGLMLTVTPDVLIPRPDTETLVDWALQLTTKFSQARVIDMGTGSGAIALALKHRCSAAHVSATDTSPQALAIARANAARHQLDIRWHQGDWWQAVPPGQRFDLILSNPPYIAGKDPHLNALQHEPRHALTPEGDGLAALRTLIQGARERLHSGGWILLEHGYDQAPQVAALLQARGFVKITTRSDLGGNLRCTGATL